MKSFPAFVLAFQIGGAAMAAPITTVTLELPQQRMLALSDDVIDSVAVVDKEAGGRIDIWNQAIVVHENSESGKAVFVVTTKAGHVLLVQVFGDAGSRNAYWQVFADTMQSAASTALDRVSGGPARP